MSKIKTGSRQVTVNFKQKLKGGKADKRKPSDFDPAQIAKGARVEREHTKDHDTAVEIAMDHLTEDPKYYDKLDKAGL